MTGSNTNDQLRQIIEQCEQLIVEKKQSAETMKDVLAEAKANGYDPKIIKLVIKLRARKKDDVEEEESLLETYKAALGM